LPQVGLHLNLHDAFGSEWEQEESEENQGFNENERGADQGLEGHQRSSSRHARSSEGENVEGGRGRGVGQEGEASTSGDGNKTLKPSKAGNKADGANSRPAFQVTSILNMQLDRWN